MENGASDIARLVHDCYWRHDINCAGTTLRVLSILHAFPLEGQVLEAATGMHGAGGFGAQCGLMEGALMFLGCYCASRGEPAPHTADICRAYAGAFTAEFGSLTCAVLRPGGFRDDDPPHLCEALTVNSIAFTHTYIISFLQDTEQAPKRA